MAEPASFENLDAVQGERARLAQSLHDTVCQTLSGAYLQAALLVRKCQPGQALSADELQALRDTLHGAVGELHELVHSLRQAEDAPSVDEIGR